MNTAASAAGIGDLSGNLDRKKTTKEASLGAEREGGGITAPRRARSISMGHAR